MTYIPLDYADLLIASLLLLLNGALSVAFQLGLARQLAIAATRMVVQLMLVGLVLIAVRPGVAVLDGTRCTRDGAFCRPRNHCTAGEAARGYLGLRTRNRLHAGGGQHSDYFRPEHPASA